MGSTFLSLTNKVLRKINEVELTETNFSSSRGMQSVAKDAVVDAISEINQQKWQWPYQAVQHTQTLQVAESEYAWPTDFQVVDWESFQLVKNDLNPSNKKLKIINRDEWYSHLKDGDEDFYPEGDTYPKYVFRAHGTGFGISPVPDKEYQIEFRYYKLPAELDAYDDVCDIPSTYDNIIVWGALVHMNLFRENTEGNQIAEAKFQQGIKNMYTILIGTKSESLTDTRINFGGQVRADNYK